MKKICLTISIFLLFVSCVGLYKIQTANRHIPNKEDAMRNKLSINDYVDMYNKDHNAILLDVRTREEVLEGKIPNSQNIPLNELENAQFDKTANIYIYCRSGRRSEVATNLLKLKGYNVINIGGYSDYKNYSK